MDKQILDIVEDAKAKQEIYAFALSYVIPAAMKAMVELGIPDILANSGANALLTSEEILEQVPNASAKSSSFNLERLLRMLAYKDVVREEQDSASNTRRYGLTSISRALVRNRHGGTMANFLLLLISDTHNKACQQLAAAILESESPFEKAHGVPMMEFWRHNPPLLKQFQKAMMDQSDQVIPLLLKYEGFKEMTSMVDVGGGIGTTLASIVKEYPHIRGVNFDIPEVIAHAPQFPGVEHIGGDMFKSIPNSCNVVFMKSIIHNLDDEDSIRLLKKCHWALPPGGRVIIVDVVLPTKASAEESLDNLCAFEADINMMLGTGLERDAAQFQDLADKSGFGKLKFIKLDCMYVVEGTKISS